MNYISLVFSCLLLWLAACSTSQPVASKQNRSYEYRPQTAVTHDLRIENDSVHIFMKYADKRFFTYPKNMVISYLVSLSYEKPEITLRDSIRVPEKKLKMADDGVIVDFKIARNRIKMPAVLLVKAYSRQDPLNTIWHDVRLTTDDINKTYLLRDAQTNLPLFRNYVLVNQPFFIEQFSVPMPGELKQFETSFTAALPPMANPDNVNAAPLKRIKTISFFSDTIWLSEKGLYSIEIGGRPVGGLLVEENAYPEVTSAPELIQPLIYLTSSKEREKLYNTKEPKAAIDQFWLGIVPDQKQARELIRTYYKRVADTNRYFSAHKAGWMTDRGMIYLIFGPPQNLNRFLDREEWGYPADSYRSAVKFVFLKKPNTFTQNHYELVRSPHLEGFWYRTVEQWRTGTVEK